MKTSIPVLLLTLLGLFATTAIAQEAPHRHVSVSGEGVVRVAPDEITVRLGVTTRDDDPEAARARNAEASAAVLRQIRQLGVPEGRIVLEQLSLQPVREWDPETRRQIENGYEAVRQVRVEMTAADGTMDALPTLVARVVQEGANRLLGVEYGLEDREMAMVDALAQAAERARAKAQRLAATLGASLGHVLTVEEQNVGFDQPMYRMAAMEAADAAPQPEAYAQGDIEVRATVRVSFSLK